MKIYLLAACLFSCLIFSLEASAKSLTLTGDTEQAQKNAAKNEAAVEEGREEREYNTLAPLAPVVEYVGKALAEGAAFMASTAELGSKAGLRCGGGLWGPGEITITTDCPTSGTHQQCLDSYIRYLEDKFDSLSNACKLLASEGNRGSGNVEITY